jgi:3-hydroxyisobutyrate dehydrogenase-like beta-hydroxyacid dehydrogenase
MKKIGFIGLGIMGGNMASHLLKKYKNINIIKRNSINTKKFIKKFANKGKINLYNNPKELAENSELIISCVGNDNDLEDIYLRKNKILDGVKKNTIIVDHTTASLNISIKLFKKFRSKQVFFFDAPVSGGEIGAQKGNLAIMVGGEKNKFEILKKSLDCYYKSMIYMGKSGNGQLTKMVNQICVASIIQGLAEGLNFAKKKKLNVENLLEAIQNGAAQSWQLENRSITMWNNKFNFGFMNKLMLKDLKILLNESKISNIELPITKQIKGFYTKLIKKGYSKEDTSNLIRLLK